MNEQALRTGLVSVTLRKLSPREIVDLVRQAKLDAIEWGGDIHVPHGDFAAAREVRQMTQDAGLAIAAYGSYYRAGVSENQSLPFDHVLETARELSAPLIRVWAGNRASADLSPADRSAVTDDLQRIVTLAAAAGITVATEYHGNSLTDTIASTRSMLDAVPSLRTLWQPPNNQPLDHCLASLHDVLDRLANVHVFHWQGESNTRLPLAQGRDRWHRYLDLARGCARFALLEFVRDDSPEQLLEDTAALKALLLDDWPNVSG